MSATEILQKPGKAPRVAEVLDTCGLLCPYPFIRAKQTLETLPSGFSLEVLTDSEPTALSSIPILCAQHGYTYTSVREGARWRLVITKP